MNKKVSLIAFQTIFLCDFFVHHKVHQSYRRHIFSRMFLVIQALLLSHNQLKKHDRLYFDPTQPYLQGGDQNFWINQQQQLLSHFFVAPVRPQGLDQESHR